MMFALERPDEIRAMEMEKIFAERANKSKTDFFIKMSHEIRTPVNTIVGMNEVILRESNEPEVRKHAMDIKTSVDTLQSLINDILDFSKIESGTMAVTPVNYNLEDILYEVINLTKLKADDKGLIFHVDVQSDIPRTYFGDDTDEQVRSSIRF